MAPAANPGKTQMWAGARGGGRENSL